MKIKAAVIVCVLLSIVAVVIVFRSCDAHPKGTELPDNSSVIKESPNHSKPEDSPFTPKLDPNARFFSKKFRSGFGDRFGEDKRLMTEAEVRGMSVEYFGIPLPEGTAVIGGVYDTRSGELSQDGGFQMPNGEVEGFLAQVRKAWENPKHHGPIYQKPIETSGKLDPNSFWGYDYSEKTVVIQFTSKDVSKKRWIDLCLDPETGFGSISWTRD